jgi:predicted AAA+ superfamily ATPase
MESDEVLSGTDDEAYCRSIGEGLAGLAVFSGLTKHPLTGAFLGLLEPALGSGESGRSPRALVAAWARFTAVFADHAGDEPFRDALYETARADMNGFTLAAERGAFDGDGFVAKLAAADLAALERAAGFDFTRLAGFYAGLFRLAGGADSALARIEAEARFLAERNIPAQRGGAGGDVWTTAAFAAFVRANGAGDFGRYNLFYAADGKLLPACNSDKVRLRDLSGYDGERQTVVSNTLRFLSGEGAANNVLLYGDRGCGKSATVKAVANEFACRGLRLVELRKTDLAALPAVMKILASRALRFILFIDDLSFEAGDGGFTALKAMLEGGVETKPSNVAIYATSNRRHLVKEPRPDRPESSGDVRAFDTMQEQLSLADRFGLTVIFGAPSQDEYLRIAEFIAKRRGVLPDDAASLRRFRGDAVRWERWFNGRSPRTAAQFVDWFSSGGGFPWDNG